MTIFVSSNSGKILEAQSILGNEIISQSMELEELQSLNFKIIVEHKLRQAYQQVKQPIIVEDTGLQIQAYGSQLPGPFIKFFLESMTLIEMCNQARESTAKAVTMAGYYDGKQFLFCEGITQGTIAPVPKGENGFGWDSLFIPSGSLQTLAEMSLEAKNVFSSRRKAFEELKERLLK